MILLTLNDEAYRPLADITAIENKKVYCEKYGYQFEHVTDGGESLCGNKMSAKTNNTPPEETPIGWGKIYAMQHLLKKYPKSEWIFNIDCDAMITNMGTKIEDVISKVADENTHIIIPADCNGINCGVMLVRNTPIGRAFLDVIAASEPLYRHWYMQENQCIQDLLVGTFLTEQGMKNGGTFWTTVSRVIPQRIMNSYDYKNLPQFKNRTGIKDILGNDGQWQRGDFVIQFPSTPLDYRLKVANIYKQLCF
jgi:hypothetical protein